LEFGFLGLVWVAVRAAAFLPLILWVVVICEAYYWCLCSGVYCTFGWLLMVVVVVCLFYSIFLWCMVGIAFGGLFSRGFLQLLVRGFCCMCFECCWLTEE